MKRFASITLCGCSIVVISLFSSCAVMPKEDRMVDRKWFTREDMQIKTSGKTYTVRVTQATGEPVLLLHEINGPSQGSQTLAHDLACRGYKVYLPCFFGSYDIPASGSDIYAVNDEWRFLSPETGSIRQDIKEIAQFIQKRHPAQSLIVIGNCMSGMLPVELLAEKGIDTAVICQPAMPLATASFLRIVSPECDGIPSKVVEKTLHVMKRDSRKKLISFNYLNDKFAPVATQFALADRTRVSGLTKQHDLYIGVPHGTADLPNRFQIDENCHAIRIHGKGHPMNTHSTITCAPKDDLETYRNQLYQALAPTK